MRARLGNKRRPGGLGFRWDSEISLNLTRLLIDSADYDSVIKEDEPSINIDERVMADWATFLAKNLQGADTLYEFTNTQSSTTETVIPRGQVSDKYYGPQGEGHEGRDFIAAGQQVFDQPRRVPVTKPSKAKRRKVKTLNDLRTAVEAEFGISKDCVDLLFPAEVPVFALKEKKWMWALSDSLRPPEWNKTAFDSLQMKVETKKLIEGLVRGHMEVSFDDVIQGKGQGLIFLLHGYACTPALHQRRLIALLWYIS